MKYHKPHFFDDFHCIGSECSDTCCAGWEIEVDETTAQEYLKEKGEFGDRLRSELGSEPGEYFFKLKNNRCPFLNKENLCDIFINIGEDRLCDICREHPRFYNWFGDYTEVGLGLCCEEAESILFSDDRPLAFVEETAEEPFEEDNDDAQEDEECENMLKEREAIFSVLQNREESFSLRVKSMLELIFKTQKELDVKESAQYLISIFKDMEALDETWPQMMQELEEKLDEIIKCEKEFSEHIKTRVYEYEHIAVYIVYRYYPESLFDGLWQVKLMFAAAAVALLYLLDIRSYMKKKEYTLKDRIDLTRRFSKEIEYCPENMERFEACCMEEYENLYTAVKSLFCFFGI